MLHILRSANRFVKFSSLTTGPWWSGFWSEIFTDWENFTKNRKSGPIRNYYFWMFIIFKIWTKNSDHEPDLSVPTVGPSMIFSTNLIIHLTSQIMILYKIVFLWFYIISISSDSYTINFDRINRSKSFGRNRNIRKPSLREIKFELGNKLIIARTRICTSWTKMII